MPKPAAVQSERKQEFVKFKGAIKNAPEDMCYHKGPFPATCNTCGSLCTEKGCCLVESQAEYDYVNNKANWFHSGGALSWCCFDKDKASQGCTKPNPNSRFKLSP